MPLALARKSKRERSFFLGPRFYYYFLAPRPLLCMFLFYLASASGNRPRGKNKQTNKGKS